MLVAARLPDGAITCVVLHTDILLFAQLNCRPSAGPSAWGSWSTGPSHSFSMARPCPGAESFSGVHAACWLGDDPKAHTGMCSMMSLGCLIAVVWLTSLYPPPVPCPALKRLERYGWAVPVTPTPATPHHLEK